LQAANKTLDNTLVLTQPNIKQFLELYQPFKIASENSLKKMVALCTDRQKKNNEKQRTLIKSGLRLLVSQKKVNSLFCLL
jgi:hypothetical protein